MCLHFLKLLQKYGRNSLSPFFDCNYSLSLNMYVCVLHTGIAFISRLFQGFINSNKNPVVWSILAYHRLLHVLQLTLESVM